MNITAVTPTQMLHAVESRDWQRRYQGCAEERFSPALWLVHRRLRHASSDKRKVFTRRIALTTQNHGDHSSTGLGRSSSDDGRFDGCPRRRFPSRCPADEGNWVRSSGRAKGEVSCWQW